MTNTFDINEHKKIKFLDNKKKFLNLDNKKDDSVSACLVPHAGLFYIKNIMIQIYSLVNWDLYDDVLIISTHHSEGNYELLTDNIKLYDNIYDVQKLKIFNYSNDSFNNEHSWIVQIPFIPLDKKISVLLIGEYNDNIANKIIKNINNKTFISVNTDLLHCGGHFKTKCPSNIDEYNNKIINKIMNRSVDDNTELCGLEAVKVFLDIAKKQNLFAKKRVYNNSRYIVNNKSSVGYAGLTFTKGPSLLQIPRAIMNYSFSNYKQYTDFNILIKKYNKSYGIFITIENLDKSLRGCIGTFKLDNNIGKTIAKYTLLSAFKDSRFEPIEKSELDNLSYKINFIEKPIQIYPNKEEKPYDSVANNLQIAKETNNILEGHGITIYFENNKYATYLASVLPKLNITVWNKKNWNKLLLSLERKANSKNKKITKIEIYKCTEYKETGDISNLNINEKSSINGGHYYVLEK